MDFIFDISQEDEDMETFEEENNIAVKIGIDYDGEGFYAHIGKW